MSGFFSNLKKIFAAPAFSTNDNFIKIIVKCNKCSEETPVFLRKTSDFSRVYEEDNAPSGAYFFVRKEILGSKCSSLIYFNAYADYNYNFISAEAEGAEIIKK